MKKRLALAMALVLAFSMVFAAVGMAKPHVNKHRAYKWYVYQANLAPLNNSGVTGTAKVYVREGNLSVSVYAAGLEAGQQHLQHIHGFSGVTTDAVCPPMSAAGTDGILTLAEGLPFYGPILLPLNYADGSFPVPNNCNEIHYFRSFTGQQALSPLCLRTIVLHGMTVGGTYDPTLPVACGELQFMGRVKVKNSEIEKFKLMH